MLGLDDELGVSTSGTCTVRMRAPEISICIMYTLNLFFFVFCRCNTSTGFPVGGRDSCSLFLARFLGTGHAWEEGVNMLLRLSVRDRTFQSISAVYDVSLFDCSRDVRVLLHTRLT